MAASLALLVSACKVGPDYERPELDVQDSFRGVVADGASMADLPWWEFFDDEVLLELIRAALENNQDLRVAVARVREARGVLRSTESAERPQVDGVADYEVSQPPGGDSQDSWELAGVAGWELDLWGGLRRATDAAVAELLASEEAQRGVVLTLVADVAGGYFDLRDLDNRLRISRRTADVRREGLRIARLRFEGGITSELEAKQAEVELASAEADIPRLQHQILVQENALRILLGRSPGDVRRGRELTDQTLPPEIPPGLPSELLMRRPDLREAEQRLIATNARVGVALADFYPKLQLTGDYGVESSQLEDLLSGDAVSWSLGLGAVTPLFDGGRRQGNLEAAKARYEQAALQYERAVLNSLREVSDSLSLYARAREVRERQEELVAATRDYRRLARLRYQHGDVSFLELLDADRQLFSAELALSGTIRDQLISMVTLYRALGGGWQAREDAPFRN